LASACPAIAQGEAAGTTGMKKLLKSSEDRLEFFPRGDVAQMGERCVRNAQVEGSNPFISTKHFKDLQTTLNPKNLKL
jgi:hypothetical protein